MGDIKREPSKRKVPRLEGFGKLSDGAARTENPGDEDGAGGEKPLLPQLEPQDGAGRTSSPRPQQQQAAESESGGEEGDPARRQMEYLVSQIPGIKGQLWEELKVIYEDAWISADDDPDSSTKPPACAGTPQINVAWDSTQTEAQPAGQFGVATGASGSGQPQPLANAGAVVEFPACHNNRRHADRSGKEAVTLATEPQNPATPTIQLGDPPMPQQFNGNLFRRWMPSGDAGWLKDLQVPEDQRCPECNYFPGPLVIDPPQHVCICVFCRELLICPTCAPPNM